MSSSVPIRSIAPHAKRAFRHAFVPVDPDNGTVCVFPERFGERAADQPQPDDHDFLFHGVSSAFAVCTIIARKQYLFHGTS
jgi:hypothetical protein